MTQFRLTRKAFVIASLVVLLIGSIVTGIIVWRLNTDQTVSPEVAKAGDNCCNEPDYGPCNTDPEWVAGYYACQNEQCGACQTQPGGGTCEDCEPIRDAAEVCQDNGGTVVGDGDADPNCENNGGVFCDKSGGNHCCYGDSGISTCENCSAMDGACYRGGSGGQCESGPYTVRVYTCEGDANGCDGGCSADVQVYENVQNLAPYLGRTCSQVEITGPGGVSCAAQNYCDDSQCGGGDDSPPPAPTKTISGKVSCIIDPTQPGQGANLRPVEGVKISVTGADGSSPEKRTNSTGEYSINITEDAFKFNVNILPADYPYGDAYTGIRTDLQTGGICDTVSPGGVGFVGCEFTGETRDGFEFVFPDCGENPPPPPPTNNPPMCTGMNIYLNGEMKGKTTTISDTQKGQSMIQLKVAGKDFDGMPAGLRICYARGGQSNSYYATGGVFTCKTSDIETVNSNEGKITVGTFSFNQLEQEIIAKEVAVGLNLGAITNSQGIKFISGIANNDGTNFCSTNPSTYDGTGTIFNNTNPGTDPFRGGSGPQPGNSCGVAQHDGQRCISDLTVVSTPPAPYCGDGILQNFPPYNETCDPEAPNAPANCRADSCNYCGDGEWQPEEGETCDPNDPNAPAGCTVQCTLPTCPNGQVDPGEQCDPQDPETGENCTNTCTLKQPKWTVAKGAGMQCVDVGQTAEVVYTVTVTNNGQGSGAPQKIEDTLDEKVQDSWVDTSSITDGGQYDPATNKITWSSPATVAVGASKTYTYKLKIPYGNAGAYQNTVKVFYTGLITAGSTDKGAVATEIISVNCTTPGTTPDTGILDSAGAKIVAGIIVFGAGLTYFYFDRLDKVLLNKISPYERLRKNRSKFERSVTEQE